MIELMSRWRRLFLKRELEASAILDPSFWIILMSSILIKAGTNRGIPALQHSLFWRYASFSKIMRTLDTSMTSTF